MLQIVQLVTFDNHHNNSGICRAKKALTIEPNGRGTIPLNVGVSMNNKPLKIKQQLFIHDIQIDGLQLDQASVIARELVIPQADYSKPIYKIKIRVKNISSETISIDENQPVCKLALTAPTNRCKFEFFC